MSEQEQKPIGPHRVRRIQVVLELELLNDDGKVKDIVLTNPVAICEADFHSSLVDLFKDKGISF